MHTSAPPNRLTRRLAGAGPAALAAGLAAAAWGLGLHGTDLAAQVYRVDLVHRHGLVIWDDGWYGGGYPLSYSVAAPAIGAAVGLGPAAVVAAAVAAWSFDRVVTGAAGGRRPAGSWYFAATTLLAVVVGQFPYLAGEAVALAALAAATRRRWWLAAGLGAGSALLSPLAAAFLVMVAAVWAGFDRRRRPSMLAAAAGAAVVIGAVGVAFPGDGPFPFQWTGLVVVEALCVVALSPLVAAPRPVRAGAAVYGLATLASFLVANPLGGNAARFAESAGLPLLACVATLPTLAVPGTFRASRGHSGIFSARNRPQKHETHPERRRRRAAGALGLAVLVPFAVWQWGPATAVHSSLDPPASDTAAFYRPLVTQVLARSAGRPVRVEVVPTRDHWESAYVAASVPIARGWERQLDVRDNPIFYRPGALDATSYHRWLLDNGVTMVALADAPLDYAGRAEAALLRRGEPGLTRVWSSPAWTLWRVDASGGLLSGPGRLVSLRPDRVVIDVARPGTLLLRIRFMRYWTRSAGDACLAASAGGWTAVRAAGAGRLVLRAALVGGHPAAC